MKKFSIVLPWPDFAALGGNSKMHWRAKSSITKAAREAAKMIALSEMNVNGSGVAPGRLKALYVLVEPDNIHRDTDNMVKALKPYQDGVFDALSRDDKTINDRNIKSVT